MAGATAQTCRMAVKASASSTEGEASNWKGIIRSAPRVKPGMGNTRRAQYSSRNTLGPLKFKSPTLKGEETVSSNQDAPSQTPAPEFEGFQTKQVHHCCR